MYIVMHVILHLQATYAFCKPHARLHVNMHANVQGRIIYRTLQAKLVSCAEACPADTIMNFSNVDLTRNKLLLLHDIVFLGRPQKAGLEGLHGSLCLCLSLKSLSSIMSFSCCAGFETASWLSLIPFFVLVV